MIRAAILALFLFCLPAWAQPKIVGRLEYPPHTLVRLQVEGVPEKTGLLWRVTPLGIDKATTSKDMLQFAAPPGVYDVEVLLFSVDREGNPSLDSLVTRVVIGATPPGPTPPGPTPPGPTPPVPPVPPPDDFTKRIKQLYDADPGNTSAKATLGRQLASLYAFGAQEAMNKTHVTAGNFDVAMFQKGKELSIPAAGLDQIRDLLKVDCQKALGGSDARTFLDEEKRKALNALFLKYSTAIQEVAK